ncbi:MAG: efflux RND transporter periplasmic adaptor subunit [Lacunisphaera sp.]
MNRTLLFLSLFAAPLSAVFAAEAPAHHPTVNVITARKASAATELVLPASLQALQEAAVYARTTGYLLKFMVDIGDPVKAGQTLALIDSPEVDQQLASAQASLLQSQANATLAAATAKRWRSLADKQAVSSQEVEEKEAAANASAANAQAAQAEVSRLTQLKGFDTVIAPFDGVISSRGADIGTLITTDTNRPLLFRITQQGTLRVYAGIPQSYMRDVKVGLEVDVLVREFPDHPFQGHISRIAGALDPQSRTLQVEVQIPNEKGELLPGMFAQLSFKLVPAQPPLLVPSNAPIIRADGNLVAVVDAQNKIHLQKVKFGRDYGSQIEILSGIEEGSLVVANPSDALYEGQVVEPLKPEPAKK